mmetsp:Transcript_29869/g.68917  ORF Transcript_29869/g.68917 Transcript_29869/m.68917 type:complete len:110 (-) Transcript_29869:516-845(-)
MSLSDYLVLSGNAIGSSLPIELGRLPNLQNLYVEDSLVEGDISFVEPMERIFELWLDINPDLRGTLPTSLGQLSTLGEEIHCTTFGFTHLISNLGIFSLKRVSRFLNVV